MEVETSFVHYFSKQTNYKKFFAEALRQKNYNYGLLGATLNNANSLHMFSKPTSERHNLFYVTSSKEK